MFGITLARLDQLSEQEKDRYQSLYCGLCFAIKETYGQVARAALSYDLAFLVMLYDSLYEPAEKTGKSHCITHPAKKMDFAISKFSYYCADLSVALAYHKCLDDIADENSRVAKAARTALESSYKKTCERIPEHCEVISDAMECIREIEREQLSLCEKADARTAGLSDPDAASIAFGEMLGFLFECAPSIFPDVFSGQLRGLGYWLGRFIYMMDAAIDFAQDARHGSYNPFVIMEGAYHKNSVKPNVEEMRDACMPLIGRATEYFEKLPCIQDEHILQCVLYSGVWQKFNQQYCQSDSQ